MASECALCQENKDLMDSHIIPNFVLKWIKKTSANPFLRGVENPDERIQDYKEPLLCDDCEQILSNWEGKFAGNVFYPHIRDKPKSIEYDDWLLKFIISVSWRFLQSKKTSLEGLDDSSKNAVAQAQTEWRDLILGNSALSNESRDHHMFLLDDIEEPAEDMPEKWEFYSDRGIDATLFQLDGGVHIYFKLPQIVFISCISPTSIEGLNGTKVSTNGKVEQPQEILNKDIGTLLMNRARAISQNSASKEEQQKIVDRMLKDPEEAIDSESFRTYQKEKKRKIESHRSTDYLNQECPVCGVKHVLSDTLPSQPLTESVIKSLEQTDKFVRAEGILMLPGHEFGLKTDEKVTGAILLAKSNATYLFNLYTETGWVIDRKFPYPEDSDEDDINEFVDRLLEDFEEYYIDDLGIDR